MTDATDCQLLERFVAEGDESAFAALTRRHAARVLRVCRGVLRDEHDAEDVLQATLLVLARKAVTLPWQGSVGGWLGAVAYRLALHARACRRRRRERPAGAFPAGDVPEPPAPGGDPASAAARREAGALVREELARLPEKYRAPAVLCYLDGLTNEQAARALGCPAGSMSRRLAKARTLLRGRLRCRGLALLTALACLALAPFWLARHRPPAPTARVADAMSAFRPAEGRPGTEELLRRLEDDPAGVDPRQVVALAEEAAHVAGRVEGHDPGRRADDWLRYARGMRLAARRLADSASSGDRPATRLAAARLHGVCSGCHETFRD